MRCAIDLGGSVIDLVGENFAPIASLESADFPQKNLQDIFYAAKINPQSMRNIFLTGGNASSFSSRFYSAPLKKIDEITAIGAGGLFLSGVKKALVVSLGTGTCCVSASDTKFIHAGGTPVGGGTFSGLLSTMLFSGTPREWCWWAGKGKPYRTDLSVGEIVGRGIGRLSENDTASCLAKLSRNAHPHDMCAGVAHLLGVSIAQTVTDLAEKNGHSVIVLGGRGIRIKPMVAQIIKMAAGRGMRVVLARRGEIMSAVGAATFLRKKYQ